MNEIHTIENYSNSYVIELEDKLILIDTGFDKKIETLSSLKKQLSYIILTHCHLDHINGLVKIKEKFPEAKVVCHKNAEEYVKGKKLLLPKGIKGFFYGLFLEIWS